MKLEIGNWKLEIRPSAVLVAAFCMLLVVAGCGGQEGQTGTPLARVNAFTLTLEAFEAELAAEVELDPQAKLTEAAKTRFLDELIRKQVLIQEARRQGLDRQERFVRTIQRYWEATLIRNLLEQKAEEIGARILVTEEQIAARHRQLLEEDPQTPALADLRDRIIAELKARQKTTLLEQWIGQLTADSKIEVDRDKLKGP